MNSPSAAETNYSFACESPWSQAVFTLTWCRKCIISKRPSFSFLIFIRLNAIIYIRTSLVFLWRYFCLRRKSLFWIMPHKIVHTTERAELSRSWKKTRTEIRVSVRNLYFTFFLCYCRQPRDAILGLCSLSPAWCYFFSTFSHHIYYFQKNISDRKIYVLNWSAKLS
jgi:hypothetical protein